jgi:tetratricopeptide (TPR) repeat protein
VLFGLAGVFFGILVGWIIGSQQGTGRVVNPQPVAQTAAPAPAETAQPLDEARAAELRKTAEASPSDSAARVQLGNLYFDAERFEEAARWYEEALKVDPRNVNASTDLGITYYYRNQPDRALQQFERSLAIDPKHSKTLLNIGIVRAFGKQDLPGAAQAWQRVIEVAPESPEGAAARRALESLRNAHPDVQGAPAGKPGSPD